MTKHKNIFKGILHLYQVSFIALVVIATLMPALSFSTYAGTFYNCIDRDGVESLSDHPVEGLSCREIQTHNETAASDTTPAEDAVKNRTTPVVIAGNRVLVPVNLTYGNRKAVVHLVLDTGASGTTIHADAAEPLYIDMRSARKAKGQVVGGGMIEGDIVTMDRVTVGPHIFQQPEVYIIAHQNPAVGYDGLLGMDLLRGLKFKVDFDQQMITWY